jgi:methionyl-tRNA formyltransferase
VDLRPLARKWGVPVVDTPNSNAPEILERLRSLEPRHVFVIGWSQICRKAFLDIPTDGAIGFHPALLPENRGRAVIPWTILQRKPEAGATLFWMDEGMDSGDVLAQERVELANDETAATLYRKMNESLRAMLDRVIPLLQTGEAPRLPQDQSKATYCAKRTPADGLIEWAMPAESVWTHIRAVGEPYPGAFTYFKGRKLLVWEAEYVGEGPYTGLPGQIQALDDSGALVQCGDGRHIRLRTVQVEGEERTSPGSVLRNHAKLGLDLTEILEMMHRKADS